MVGIGNACFFGFSWEKFFLSHIPNLEGVKFNPVRKLFLSSFSIVRHRDGSKLNTQRKIFSLCAQWARIFDSTCGPVGQKLCFNFCAIGTEVPTHWVGSCFHIFRISEGSKSTQRKIFLHHWCRSSGSHRVPGYFATIGREVWRGGGPLVHNYLLQIFASKTKHLIWSFLKKVSLLTYRTLFIEKRTPPFRKKWNFLSAPISSPLDTKLTPTPVTSGRAPKVPLKWKTFCRQWRWIYCPH